MSSLYGSTETTTTISSPSVQAERVACARPCNNGHYHIIACIFIVVAPVSLYSLLNIYPLINNPPSDKADDINAIRTTAVVIYGTVCVAIVLFMVKYIHTNRGGRERADENELVALHPRANGTPRGYTGIRDVVLTILFLGSFIHTCVSVMTNDLDTVGALLFAFTFLFCILQLPLVLYFSKGRSDSRLELYLLAFVTTGNACICVEFLAFSLLQPQPPPNRTHIQKMCRNVESVLCVCRVHYAVFATFLLFTNMGSRSDETHDVINHPQNEVRNTKSVRGNETSTIIRNTWWRKAKHYLTITVRFISRQSLYFSLIYCAFLISVNIAAKAVPQEGGEHNSSKHRNHSNHNTTSLSKEIKTMYRTVETGCAYACCVVDFIVLIFAGLETSVVRIKLADTVLLLVSLSSFIVISMIEVIIDAKYLCNLSLPEPQLDVANFILLNLFLNLEIYCQTALILKVSSLRPKSPLTLNQVFVRGTIVFLCVHNFEKWVHDSFLFPNDYSMFKDNSGAVKAWYGLALPFNTIGSLYRLLSAILCYETLLSYPWE